MSEHDDPDRPVDPGDRADPADPAPPAEPDEQPESSHQPPYEPPAWWQGPPPGADEPTTPYAAPPSLTSYPPPSGYPAGPSYPGYAGYPVRSSGSRVPGWLWPVVAVTALVLGVLGGILGGVMVSTSMNHAPRVIPLIGADSAAPKPLPADNGSIAAVAAKVLPSTVQVRANGGADGRQSGGATGSGFVFDGKGHVITNNHVVADATGPGELKVVDSHGRSYKASIVGRSPVYDIAVLQVSGGSRLPAVPIGSSHAMRVGQTVVAIGSPLGLNSTVTSGIISALDRPVTTGDSSQSSFIDAVQTDAAINPGNSGGPLVNLRGEVIGVNSAIATVGATLGGEAGNIGVGFAIPMEQVRVTASQILATGQARYPVIGATVNTGGRRHGAQVITVPSGTPADKAGLRKGDLVVGVNNEPVKDGIGLIVAIRAHRPGDTITLTIERSGHRERLRVTLDSKVG
ncbi:MAG TPA: trypsin-like peptidase domain-containing protein [Nocardioidaceae bacterium]|nr:trypsin-like peptidase domain-containing protein [Nocardioidaceae bacterium]